MKIIYLPILGALALASGTILQKMVLRKRKINIKLYQTSEFLAIVLVMLPFIYFFWKITPQAFETKSIFIFLAVIIFSVTANLFTFYSMKWEKISNLEPAKILEPLFVILLAVFFSYLISEEMYSRNLKIVILALIAGLALIFSHIKKDHLKFNRYFIAAVLGSFFFAAELVISRLILDFYSPVTFYFLRCFFILLISFAVFRPKFKRLGKKVRFEILAIGFVWFIYRVVIYYGYINYGIIFTTLIIMLGPIFVYTFAWKFLREKLNWKNIVSTAVIVGCILYASLS